MASAGMQTFTPFGTGTVSAPSQPAGRPVAKVTLAGLPVPGGIFGAHTWRSQIGSAAPEITWAVPPSVRDALLKLKPNQYGVVETTITITPPGQSTTTWKRVIFLKETASGDPLIANVVLTDVRWYLQSTWISRFYNMVVPSSATTFVNQTGLPLSTSTTSGPLGVIVPVQVFAPFSLNDGSEWNAEDFLEDVGNVFTLKFGIEFLYQARDRKTFFPQNVFLNARGHVAFAQALNFAGGLDMRVSVDGEIEFVDAYNGAERETIVDNVTYSLIGLGFLRWVDMGLMSPALWNMLFAREIEVRADGWEQAPGTGVVIVPGNLPLVECVIKVTDFTISVPNPDTGQSYLAAQGTYVPADPWFTGTAAFAAANDPTPHPNTKMPWSRASFLQLANGDGLARNFGTDYVSGINNSVPWTQRVDQARTDMRQTWRLNPAFAKNCVPGSIKAVRAEIINPATGVRQASPVFHDWARRPNARGLSSELFLMWNVNAWPASVNPAPQAKTYLLANTPGAAAEVFPTTLTPIANLQRSPSILTVEDSVNGIFHESIKPDNLGLTAHIVPSLVFNVPNADVFQIAKSPSGQASFDFEYAPWCSTHRICFIFTATPAGPNADLKYHRYQVSSLAALRRLGVPTNAVNARGLNQDVNVPPGDGTFAARVPWNDANRDNLLLAFNAPAQSTSQSLGLTPVNDLVLSDYAVSLAAVRQAPLLDHFEGTATIGWTDPTDTGLGPIGALQAVAWTVTADGQCFTSYNCAPSSPPLLPETFMSTWARQRLLRAIGPLP